MGVGTIAGAITGALIGGISGAISAAIKGKSVWAGAATGAATGLLLGVICGSVADSISTGGAFLGITHTATKLLAASVACGTIAFSGNTINQYQNYRKENRQSVQTTTNKYTSPENKASANTSFWNDYYDVGSAATSAIGAAVFAPLSVGGGCVVNSAFQHTDVVGNVLGSVIIGADISALQSIIDLF